MTNRKEIRVGQPVRVKADGRTTVRTKIHPRIVRRKTTMTERDGVVLRNFRRDLVAPRIRPPRSTEQPTDEHPQSEAQQDNDSKNRNSRRWIFSWIIRLTEQNHGSIPHGSADHLQDPAQAIIATQAALVKRRSREGLPV